MRMRTRMAAGVTAGLLALTVPAAAAAAPDAWITTKAKMALFTTAEVPATAINVDTVNGKVTLHGKVATEEQKAKAEQVARGIEGATEVRNLLQVVPESARDAVASSDAEIAKDVREALKEDESLGSMGITVQSVNDGVVLLGGTAPTMSAHLQAMQTARAVEDVRRVASAIESPGRLSDAELRGEAAGSTSARRDADAEGAIEQGSGAIGDAARATGAAARKAGDEVVAGARAAGDTAGDVGGATTSAARDIWITSAAKLRLMADDEAPALDINVDTTDGVVTLFGLVGTEAAKQSAETEARKVSGVREVRNHLQVVPTAEQAKVEADDAAVQQAVEQALANRDALTDADIDVAVKDGVVRLTGTVPSESARMTAATAARSASGVRSVLQEDLQVEGADRM